MSTSNDSSRDDRLNEILAEYLQAQETEREVDQEQLFARYPDYADELRQILADKFKIDEIVGQENELDQDTEDEIAKIQRDAATLPPPSRDAGRNSATIPPAQQIAGSRPTSSSTVEPGDSIRYFGDYELLDEIARGGMGVVYKARQVKLNRIVAVKMILSGQLAGEEDVKRFYVEAEAAANLQHPNIVAIHEVGEHQGQHYFSMDYVDGQSLADIVRPGPLPASQAADCVKTIAETIQFAHEHGTLHRDLKPGNVLIDKDDKPRITDFGLAKRIEGDAELTATGAVLGTPSYMPPEQIAAKHGEVGPASDVYALGAILYELMTGHPPFQSDSPLDTLIQVLENHPVPPRSVDSRLPLDLETICLKCLQKDPQKRYASARELAADLERFLNHEPIEARPISKAERASRWLWKHRRVAAIIFLATIIAPIVVAVCKSRLDAYQKTRLGKIHFTTDGTLMTAELLDAERDEVILSTTAPTSDPIVLPAGDYRVRFSALGHSDRTCRMLVYAGEERHHKIDLSDRNLWGPIEDQYDSWRLIQLNDRPTLVGLTNNRICCRNAQTGELIWEADREGFDYPALLFEAFPDLNGDHADDLVILRRASPRYGPGANDGTHRGSSANEIHVSALSGSDGQLLWNWSSTEPLLDRPVLYDVDQDGLSDLIMTRALQFKLVVANNQRPVRWVEAIAGRSGQPLWQYQILSNVDIALKEELVGRWDDRKRFHRAVDVIFGPAEVVEVDGRANVVVVCGTQLHRLDAYSGKSVSGPHDLGFHPISVEYTTRTTSQASQPDKAAVAEMKEIALERRPVVADQFRATIGDVNGDGQKDLLLTVYDGAQGNLLAVAPSDGSILWKAPFSNLNTPDDPRTEETLIKVRQIKDLDGDGLPEVIVARLDASRWTLVALDGRSGKKLWTRRAGSIAMEFTDEHANHHLLTCPSTGDNRSDLIIVAELVSDSVGLGSWETKVLAQRISGSTGAVMWTWEHGIAKGGLLAIAMTQHHHSDPPPMLWRNETLVVSTGGVTHLISLETGKLESSLSGINTFGIADLNGDGSVDLLGTASDMSPRRKSIFAFLHRSVANWERLGSWTIEGQDFDSDGVTDLLNGNIHNQQIPPRAVSGRDGRVLWESTVPRIAGRDVQAASVSPPLPGGDFDRDGISDILIIQSSSVVSIEEGDTQRLRLDALSGRTGRVIWKVKNLGNIDLGSESLEPQFVICKDGDGDGETEIYLGLTSVMFLLSATDGSISWSVKLRDVDLDRLRSPAFTDLDGDGTLDLLFARRDEISALDGTDGRQLWARPLDGSWWNDWYKERTENWRKPSTRIDVAENNNLPIGDVDGDGRHEYFELDKVARQVSAFDLETGKTKWTSPELYEAFQGGSLVKPINAYLGRFDGVRTSVCLYESNSGELVILDEQGKPRLRKRFPGILSMADLDRDVREEILSARDGQLTATRVDEMELTTIWSRSWSDSSTAVLLEPSGSVTPGDVDTPVVALRTLSGDKLYLIDGSTGELQQRIHYRPTSYGTGPGWILSSDALRHVVEIQKTRLTQSVEAWSIPESTANLHLNTEHKFLRTLPWHEPLTKFRYWSPIPAALAFLVIVFPLMCIVLAVKKRSMVIFLSGLVLAALMTLLHFLCHENPSAVQLPDWTTIAMAVPNGIFLMLLIAMLRQRHWHRIWMLVTASLLVAAGAAIFWLWLDAQLVTSATGYTSEGWPLIGLLGTYWVGVAVICIYPASLAISATGRVVRALPKSGKLLKWLRISPDEFHRPAMLEAGDRNEDGPPARQ